MREGQADVVIIGAGAAGMAAAAALARAGAQVVVLEARDRLGGRIWTQQPQGWPMPIELGAEFLHGENQALAAWVRGLDFTEGNEARTETEPSNSTTDNTEITDRICVHPCPSVVQRLVD